MSLAAFEAYAAEQPDGLSQVWHAESLARAEGATATSGFAALDAELPGGGWPVGAMTEVLHAGPETHAWPLLLPALAAAVRDRGKPVALIGAPHMPFGPSLAAQGLPPQALLWVRCDAPAARMWACEQALRCADVAAVLAWLPQARVGELRRLQLAAAQHAALLWVFRPAARTGHASPARLRLLVEADGDGATLAVHLVKRRGPPLGQPVAVPSQPSRLSAVLAASRLRRERRDEARRTTAPALVPEGGTVVRLALRSRPSPEAKHAVDRAAVAA